MALTEKMFSYICDVLDKKKVTFRGMTVDLKKPFRRIKMTDFIKKETKIDFDREIKNDQDAIAIAKKHQIELLPHQKNRGHIVSLFFEKYCEEKCVEPTIVYGYPIEISPLAKKMYEDPRYVERFELFICGKEFANCYSELNDPIDQLERFKSQVAEKEHGNDEADEIDYEFVEALEYGMPPTGGIGFGIDRLIMLFTNQDSIRNVLLFPHLREEKK
jgi:lysyl-tRNA synthetase class 2